MRVQDTKKYLIIIRRRYFKRGQSLIELAIFSTVIFFAMGILISFGLGFNENQRAAMFAFRRQSKLAQQIRKTFLSASLTLIYDKAIANPGSIWGIGDRQPISASSSGVLSNDLYSSAKGYDEELPRIIYDINGKIYVLKTAAFIKKYRNEHIAKRKAAIDDWNPETRDKSWKFEYPGDDDSDRKFGGGTSWDIDGDGEEEFLVEKSDMVMDSQDGQLDLTETDPEKINGLLPDIKITALDKSSLTNKQVGVKKTTVTSFDRAEIFERRIKLNPHMQLERDMEQIREQIKTNNKCCYKVKLETKKDKDEDKLPECELKCPKGAKPCDDDEKDEIVKEENGKFIIVRSKFYKGKKDYAWTRND